MLADIHQDISRQSQYTSGQRDAIDELAAAVTGGAQPGAPGPSAATTPATPSGAPATAATSSGPTPGRAAARRPFATIRFDQPTVDYEPTLRAAVQRALRQRPDLSFEVVGVSPASTGPSASPSALGRARTVMGSLAGMGLPLDRLSMSSTTSAAATSDEVQIFVR
jgi:hypothetical protein